MPIIKISDLSLCLPQKYVIDPVLTIQPCLLPSFGGYFCVETQCEHFIRFSFCFVKISIWSSCKHLRTASSSFCGNSVSFSNSHFMSFLLYYTFFCNSDLLVYTVIVPHSSGAGAVPQVSHAGGSLPYWRNGTTDTKPHGKGSEAVSHTQASDLPPSLASLASLGE